MDLLARSDGHQCRRAVGHANVREVKLQHHACEHIVGMRERLIARGDTELGREIVRAEMNRNHAPRIDERARCEQSSGRLDHELEIDRRDLLRERGHFVG